MVERTVSQLWRLCMSVCLILAIFCSAWKQPLILTSFTVACLGSCMHEQAQTLNLYSNHENSLRWIAWHCSLLSEPHWCKTQTWSLNSEQIHKGNGFILLLPACGNVFLCWRTPEMPVWLRKTFPAKATVSSAAVFLHFSPSTLIMPWSVLPLSNEQVSKKTTLTSSLCK